MEVLLLLIYLRRKPPDGVQVRQVQDPHEDLRVAGLLDDAVCEGEGGRKKYILVRILYQGE